MESQATQSGSTEIPVQQKSDEFYFRNGLRYVKPYYADYVAHVKQRWHGRTLIDVYLAEFPFYGREYLEKAIETGRLTVNKKKVASTLILGDNQVITNTVHRHEPPILDEPIRFIAVEKDVYVIEKPSGVPVHPCGRYKKNSITYVLEHEYQLKDLYPIHRIDNHTSGVLIIGRSKEFAQGFGKKMMSRSGTLKKLYFARASGKLDTKGVLSLRMGISQKDIRAGTWIAQENGKYDACTLFSTICYCPIENTTLVLCRPLTGRTHQIRVHLEALSCPIVNDVLYNPNDVEEPPLKRVRVEEFNFEKDDLCSDCQKKEKETTKEEFTKNEMLFLHAWMYKQETAPEWKYESGIPEWAKRDLEKMNVNESNVHEIADTLLREEIPEDLQKTESGTDI